MTPNQQTAWALITSTPGGCFAEEIGQAVHGHTEGFCDWCGQSGIAICRSKALRGLVIRRKATRRWEPREARYRAQEPTAQITELPDDLFGDAA
jgi:hypothetical protein